VTPDVDLVVVGGGPVGLGTALEARAAGLEVVVIEPRRPPIDKACGEGLMPGAVSALARLGVRPAGRPFHGIHYLAPGAAAVARFRTGTGLGVRRTTLSTALWDRADEVGVRHVADGVTGVDPSPGRVRVTGRDGTDLTSRWVVAADGLHSVVRRGLGLDDPRPIPRRAVRYGLRRHFAVEPWTDLVEVHWAPDAEAYVTPVGPDVVGVAVLGPGGAPFETWLDRFPALRRRLDGVPATGPARGAGPLRQRAARHVAGPVLLVGDAAGYVDALTGEGVAVGLSCARALVRCLVEGRPEDYERAWWRTTRRYRLLTSGLLAATRHPAPRRLLVPAAQRLPGVFTGIVGQLGR
jgi:flavin-dependent dehydrogenase